jgi:Uma2 family endonuclease
MSVILPPTTGIMQLPPEPVRRFTVDEYHQMINVGIIQEDDPCELLEGWVIPKMPRNPEHDLVVALAEEEIARRLPAGWHRRIQSGLTTADSEPEPDVMVVRGPKRLYGSRKPGPADLGLVVEVADSTLTRDRTTKLRIYARAAIVIYWIINIPDRQIEVYSDPTGPEAEPRYRQRLDHGPQDLVPLVLDGKEVERVSVRDVLP